MTFIFITIIIDRQIESVCEDTKKQQPQNNYPLFIISPMCEGGPGG